VGQLGLCLGVAGSRAVPVRRSRCGRGLVETRLIRHEDGTYTDVWRRESAEQMTTALTAAAGFALVNTTLALTHDAAVQNGEIIDER
jgi:hypothetical protein